MFETYSTRIQLAQHKDHRRTRSCLTRQCNVGRAAIDQPIAVVEDVTVGMLEVPLTAHADVQHLPASCAYTDGTELYDGLLTIVRVKVCLQQCLR
jgi:hypothetical protein